MLRGIILIGLLGVAGFLGYKLWSVQKSIDAIKAETGATVPAQQTPKFAESTDERWRDISGESGAQPKPEASSVGGSRDLQSTARNEGAQKILLDDIAAHISRKGGEILDKKLFSNIEACERAVNVVVEEYKRRGIDEAFIIDSSAMLDIAGATMRSINNVDSYLYLVCYPHPQNLWAGYVQYRLSREAFRRLQDERETSGSQQ